MNVLVNGFLVKVGSLLVKNCFNDDDVLSVSGVDFNYNKTNLFHDNCNFDYVFKLDEAVQTFSSVRLKYDVIIDFSNRNATENLCEYASKTATPTLICTTGQTKSDLNFIYKLSKIVPVMIAKNTSIGINAINKILTDLSEKLQNFSVEIVETHHKNKLDKPSGTAILLSETLKKTIPNSKIGVSSLRLFDTVGKHDIIFSNELESITISHNVFSRKCFSLGAISLAKKLVTMQNGLYFDGDV